MIRSIIISLLLFVTLTSGWCQNLVLNPSFECGIDSCSPTVDTKEFGNYACHWISATRSTPDVFSTFAEWMCYTKLTPTGHFGFQLPRTGQRFAGIYTHSRIYLNSYREYVEAELEVALIPGELYCAEMYVSPSEGANYVSNNLGFYFHDDPIKKDNFEHTLDYSPQILEKEIITDTSRWTRVAGNFVATSASKYLTIGNFFDDSHTEVVFHGKWPDDRKDYAYYFIDDVSVEKLPDDAFVFSGNTTVCEGDSVKLFASIGGNIVTWTTLQDTLTVVARGSSLKAKPTSSTSYRVKVYGCGKVVKDTIEVRVLPRPQLNLGPDVNTCTYSPLILDAGPGDRTYSWNDHSESRYLPVEKTGEYSVKVKDENGCVSEDSVSIVVHPVPEVDLGKDYLACDEFLPLKAKAGDWTYLWSSGSTDSVFTPSEYGKYWVTVKNQCGEATDSVAVYGVSDIFIPNVLTLNQDNLNEKFKIGGVDDVIVPQLMIFNRWGEKIFSEKEYRNTWPEDSSIPSGTYYYSLNIPGCRMYKGWINVLR